jgi:small subunit ribosomal protein S6
LENRYETICIIKPDLGDEAIKAVVRKATDSLKGGGGQINKVDEWGRRRLAYPIQKKNEGYYVLFDYTSAPAVSKELVRILRLNEDVVRHQTVRFEGPEATPQGAQAPAETAEAGGAESGTEGGSDE